MIMNIGDRVTSRLYEEKGPGTILSFSLLFGEEYAEVLFSNGEKISTRKNDLVKETDIIHRLSEGDTDNLHLFFAKNMLARLDSSITDTRLIGSANYKIKPLPHQLLTVNFVMNRFRPRCLIADEVGLGKTIEAILVYQEYKLRKMVKRILIIVPSGLVLQWHEELANKFDEQFVIYTNTYIHSLKQSYGKETNVWKMNDRIIVSIDSLKPLRIRDDLDKDEIKRREWHNRHMTQAAAEADFDIVIFDEAHKLSKKDDGSESARFKLADVMSDSVPIFMLLTATPHQGDEALFHHLMKLVDPVLFASTESLIPELVSEVTVRNKKRAAVDMEGNRIFKHRITSIIKIERNETENKDELALYDAVTEYTTLYYNLAGKSNDQLLILLVMLYQRIVSSSSFALRDTMKKRLAFLENELTELENTDEDIDVDDAGGYDIKKLLTLKLNKTKEDIGKEKEFIKNCIEKAEKLALVFGDAKLKKLLETIDEMKKRENNPDLKFIIFTEFRSTQSAIMEYLSRFGYHSAFIHGSLSREQKAEQVEQFREKDQILVSTDAGGEGINLQFCYCMINYDLPWNPARLEQRIGRIDRIGQEHNVLIFNFHLADTVEDHVRSILEQKLMKIREQFGEDKYADVLSLLQEEFDFDSIYIDAIALKEKEDRKLDRIAEELCRKAKQIIEEDMLLIPFSGFTQNPDELLNTDMHRIIRNLVFHYLAYRNITVNEYRDTPDLYYFTNPFTDESEQGSILRYVTFKGDIAFQNSRNTLINLEHPVIQNILKEISPPGIGQVMAMKVSIHKFSGIKGFWFLYQLSITNNAGKQKISHISVFMENKDFCNNRISTFLDSHILESGELIPNFTGEMDIHEISRQAFGHAQEKANEIFTAITLRWLEELNKFEQRANDYRKFRKNAINAIRVDNIRESKLKALEKDTVKEERQIKMQRNIIPKLELYQVSSVEFL
ncbi:MAG: DEAD/DEAH box helicase [Spirochaetales bacterium]|nr:DEAD/DEAH box helicase [Spirochaetales bacterium]